MTSPYDTPTKDCPYCGGTVFADWADVGVGMIQCGPYHCDGCNASEIGEDIDRADDEEKRTGFFKGTSEPDSSANVINGRIVSAEQMKEVYQEHFTGNPLWHDKDYVRDWYAQQREVRHG